MARPSTDNRQRRRSGGGHVRELEEALRGTRGSCPDCADTQVLVPVDEDELEWCCVRCGAAFVSWQRWTAPAGSRAPSQVA